MIVPDSWAVLGQPVPKNSPSVEEFSAGLTGLAESTDRLADENVRQERQNADLKQRVSLLEKKFGQLIQDNRQLETEILALNEQTKGKDDALRRLEGDGQKSLEDLKKVDQEIALSKIALAEREKQQKYLLEILALVRKKDPVQLDMKSVLDNQEVLKERLTLGEKRVEVLERKYKELSFWFGDVAVSLPQLNSVKKQVREQIDGLRKNNVSDQWGRNHLEMRSLEGEIKEIVFQHDLYMDMASALESQYAKGGSSKESRQEEQKLEINLSHLKRKNRALQGQAAELRFEMVNLDKKKTELEAHQ